MVTTSSNLQCIDEDGGQRFDVRTGVSKSCQARRRAPAYLRGALAQFMKSLPWDKRFARKTRSRFTEASLSALALPP